MIIYCIGASEKIPNIDTVSDRPKIKTKTKAPERFTHYIIQGVFFYRDQIFEKVQKFELVARAVLRFTKNFLGNYYASLDAPRRSVFTMVYYEFELNDV